MKRLVILGSTGSIGVSTLSIVEEFPDRFEVVGLTGGVNSDKLEQQIRRFRPKVAALADEKSSRRLRDRCRGFGTEILGGQAGLDAVATYPDADLVVSAIVGAAGLVPTYAAICAGRDVALANKETLVMAGELIRDTARRRGVRILPIDSEHSAIFQVMAGNRREDLHRVILTASGGPFLNIPRKDLERVAPREALRHPTWKMGEKITVDSATLMNKGLEVMEARWLFDLPPERIDVVIHRQSIVHSLVEFIDGSVMAQLGVPDMRGPIAYALHYPERLPLKGKRLELAEVGSLTFAAPDRTEFPCLDLAYRALEAGGSMPAVLNAANEVAVGAFLQERVGFLGIPEVIGRTMDAHRPGVLGSLEDVLAADRWAREHAESAIHQAARRGRSVSVSPLPDREVGA